MRRALQWAVCSALTVAGCSHTATIENPKFKTAREIVWAGIDYSTVQMVGLEGFSDRDEIMRTFPGAWNELFIKEMIDDLGSALGKPVVVEIAGVMKGNRSAPGAKIVSVHGSWADYVEKPHLTPAEVAERIRSYGLPDRGGIGMVIIVERLVKSQQTGCLYTVLFDWKTREILHLKRGCHRARGFGFRNYWFRPVKEAVWNL
jgi:hypothetical protein